MPIIAIRQTNRLLFIAETVKRQIDLRACEVGLFAADLCWYRYQRWTDGPGIGTGLTGNSRCCRWLLFALCNEDERGAKIEKNKQERNK